MAVKHGPWSLNPRKGSRPLKPNAWENFSYLEHKTNDWVWSKINFLLDPQESLLATVKRLKRAWFGHVTRLDSLFKIILQFTLEDRRRRGQQRSGPSGRGPLLIRPSCPPNDLVGQGTELNWTCSLPCSKPRKSHFLFHSTLFAKIIRLLPSCLLLSVHLPRDYRGLS